MPDSCSIPTTTIVLTEKLSITSDASGNFDVIGLPSLATYAWSTRGNLSGSGVTYVLGGVAGGTVAVTTHNAGGFDFTALGATIQRYRIAGWGVRLRSTAGLNTNGEVTVVTYPAKGLAPPNQNAAPAITDTISSGTRSIPSYTGTAGPVDSLDRYLSSMGLPYTGSGNTATLDSSRLVAMPHHGTASHSQVAARGIHVRSFPFEPDSCRFKNMAFTSLGTDSVDCISSTNAGVCQQYAVNMDPWRVDGYESILIGGVGFPASTLVGNVEFIYHLEAVPNPNLSVHYRASCRPSPVIPDEYDRVRRAVSKVAHVSFADLVTRGEDYVLGQIEGQASKYGASAVTALGGMLTRLMAAA